MTDRGSILLIVYTAFSAAMLRGIWQSLPPATLAALGLVMAVLLASAVATIVSASRALGFGRADEVALLFCGSQKSLISGVPITNALASGAVVGPLLFRRPDRIKAYFHYKDVPYAACLSGMVLGY